MQTRGTEKDYIKVLQKMKETAAEILNLCAILKKI